MRTSSIKKRRDESPRRAQGDPAANRPVVPPAEAPISRLGWSRRKAADVRASLRAFEEDWNAPGMEAYDRL